MSPVPQSPVRDPSLRQDGPRNEGEKICHLVESHAPDTALCGKDVTGWPWNPPWPYCVVCLDLAESRPGWADTLRLIRGG